ncbi:uncharacterized protein LY79DRAFT_667609 [Colletotrichum navitas]|uniref:DUF7514 domain-containing protein n=1 Tax=Colletotrichum navitas TaxID=681940 RepID=A0AAD8Q6H8_9PEZI|nr:uncharacterized protein LY79DRAFT_667609 [Colletotrichum navitas]KAK1596128.1 hypothetical protein LY79DRAFT_667609 [Colletotrichum navitas]
MATKPAEKAVRPRLNTTMDWASLRAAAGYSSGPEEGVSTSSAGKSGREGQKEGHGRGGLEDGRPQQRRHGSESLAMESSISNLRNSLGDLSPSVVKELKKMIKEEVAQVAQVVQLKNSETDTPANRPRPSPVSSQKAFSTPSCPTPSPCVVEARSSSKVSLPRDRSPVTTHAKTASTIPVPVGQSTPPVSPRPKTVHFQSGGPSVIHYEPCTGSRSESVSPTAPATVAQAELSSVDKAWGMLFDSEGYSTQRLNSVLRGLANSMIAEFGYPETLVVTPNKMLALYTRYRIEPEKFPYEDIFKERSEDALKRIEFLYQDLGCPYHLVQAAPRSHPSVPGLTPAGFAKWMVSNILAYPESEARRLHAIVSALPVDADGPLLEGKPERLPRQLSRHLLPGTHDNKVRKILNEAVWDCLEDAAPSLPPTSRAARVSEADAHSTRRPSTGADDPKHPAPVPHRKTYDRGDEGPHRHEPHPARLSRHNSDTGASLPRHRNLSPPPARRLSAVHQTQRSPAPANRYSASLPAIPQHHVAPPSPLSQRPSAYDERGSDADYGVYSGHRDGRGSDSRDESPRSPGIGRRSGTGAGSGRRPTWEEVHVRKGSSGGIVSSVDAGPHRSSR